MIEQLKAMPETVERTLACHDAVREVAEKYYRANNFLYLGRLYNFPVALEGALKLKEISYIHAEGYPAAEMKHGPIALVDEETPSVFVIPRGQIHPKIISNLEEIKARKGPVIAIACEGDDRTAELADDVIFVPEVEEYLQPLVTVLPAAAFGLPRGPASRLQRRPAPESRQKRHGRMTSFLGFFGGL